MDDSVTNEMRRSILFPEKFSAVSLYVQPDYARIHADLALPGVNLTLLWMEYSISKKTMPPSRSAVKYDSGFIVAWMSMTIHGFTHGQEAFRWI